MTRPQNIYRRYWRLKVPLEMALFVLMSSVACLTRQTDRYKGFLMVAIPPYDKGAFGAIKEAIDLLETTDLRRFKRLQRYVERIVLCDMRRHGTYSPVGRVCTLKHRTLTGKHAAITTACAYSIVLVHEATHGYLQEMLPTDSRTTHERIEGICKLEHKRYTMRLARVLVAQGCQGLSIEIETIGPFS
jgi:hypothetical protein